MNGKYRLLRYDWPLHFVLFLTNWMPDNVLFLRVRGWLAHWFLRACGKDLRLGRGLTFYNPSKIFIGDHVYIAKGNWFASGTDIRIGDEVIFGPYSVMTSSNHTMLNGSYHYGEPIRKPIDIGAGSWIAANCTIVAGTTIGQSCLIAANTVAHGDIPDRAIFGGVPGRVIRIVDEEEGDS